MSGVRLIAAERQRQINAEGWTPEHDDTHRCGELACAAAVYATPPIDRDDFGDHSHPQLWPWSDGYKPTPEDRIGELARAGALVAAEIDRLLRNKPSA